MDINFPLLMPAPVFRFDNNTKIIWDGNSLFAGIGASSGAFNTPTQAMALHPFNQVSSSVNLAISGQTWRQMNGLDGGSSADVDAAYDPTKKNILICWEGTNAIYNVGRTGIQAAQDAGDYIAARKTLFPDLLIVVLTTIPRRGNTTLCNYLLEHDQYLKDNRQRLGIDLIIDIRQEIPLINFLGDSDPPFSATQSLWAESSFWIHFNDYGYSLVSKAIADCIRYLNSSACPVL
jgi:hypothetical protein